MNDINIWFMSLALLALYVPLAHLISYFILIKIRKINKTEAFFIGSPGGLLEMTLGAEECKADSKKSLINPCEQNFFNCYVHFKFISYFFFQVLL